MDFPLCISKPQYFTEHPDDRQGKPKSASLKKILLKRVPCENIVYRLRGREIWGNFRRPGTEVYLKRSMYLSVTPNLTVSNVDKPAVSYYRRFTPDGKNLLAFSGDRLSLEIYKFKGSECVTQLFLEKAAKWKKEKKEKPELIGVEEEDVASSNIRAQIFTKVFQLKLKIAVAPPDEYLLRECSLFTHDLRYVIVVTEKFSEETLTHLNNESVEPNPKYPLQDYTIHLVDLHKGVVTDRRVFKCDKIWFNNNQGMYLYQDRLAIFSVLYQTVHLFQVESGHFREIQQLGRFVFPGDESLLPRDGMSPEAEAVFGGIRQRILAHLFKLAVKTESSERLTRFHQYYNFLCSMKIWKMQLLDEDHLLLKYSREEVVTLKCPDPNMQYCLLVFYKISTAEVIALSENTDDDMLDTFDRFQDHFRNNILTDNERFCTSSENNCYSMASRKSYRHRMGLSKTSSLHLTRRILANLPINAQSFNASPYLDFGLFSYDDSRMHSMERPRPSTGEGVRFFSRESGRLKFGLHAGMKRENPPSSANANPTFRYLTGYIFHPDQPFVMSLEPQSTGEIQINFHLRLDHASVMD